MSERVAGRNLKPIAAAAITVVVAAAALFAARTGDDSAAATPPLPASAGPWQKLGWVQSQPVEMNGLGVTTLFASRRTTIGALAWGETDTPDPMSREGVRPRGLIWTSVDGMSWTTIPLPTNGGIPFVPTGVAAGEAGILAFGRLFLAEAPDSVVFSADGITWQAAAMPGGEVSMSMAVAVGSEFLVPGIVAGQPVVWATADRGGSWTAEVIPAQGLVGLGNLSVTSTGSFFTGHLATDRDWDAAIWRRAGLGSWERLARAEPEFEDPERFADVTQIVGFEGGLLAIGSAGERAPCDALGMGGGRGGGIASVARPLLDTCADMPAAAWVSADAEQWDPIEGPRPAGWRGGTVYLGDVVTGADGLVGLINESPDGGNPAYGVWSSANGREWRRIGGEFARGNAFPQGTFAFPDRLVVLGGTEDGHVTTWIGEAATDP